MDKKEKSKGKKVTKGKLDSGLYEIRTKALKEVEKVEKSPRGLNIDLLTNVRKSLTDDNARVIDVSDKIIINDRIVLVDSINSQDPDDSKLKMKLELMVEDSSIPIIKNGYWINSRSILDKLMKEHNVTGITPNDFNLFLYSLSYLDAALKTPNSRIARYAEKLPNLLNSAGEIDFFTPPIEIKIDDIFTDLNIDSRERSKKVTRLLNRFFMLTHPTVPVRAKDPEDGVVKDYYKSLIQFTYVTIPNEDETIKYDAVQVKFNCSFAIRQSQEGKEGVTYNSLVWIRDSKYNSVLRATLYTMILIRRGYHTSLDKKLRKAANKDGITYADGGLKIRLTVEEILDAMGESQSIYFASRSDDVDLNSLDDLELTDEQLKRKESGKYKSPKQLRSRNYTDFRKARFITDLKNSLDDLKSVGLITKYSPNDITKLKWQKPITRTVIYVFVAGTGWSADQKSRWDYMDILDPVEHEEVVDADVISDSNTSDKVPTGEAASKSQTSNNRTKSNGKNVSKK